MNRPTPELIELCGAVRDEAATPEQIARLEAILRGDAGARLFYRRFTQIHATLERYEAGTARHVETAPAETATTPRATIGRKAIPTGPFRRAAPWFALAACVAIVASVFVHVRPSAPRSAAATLANATTTDALIGFIQEAHGATLIPRAGAPVALHGAIELQPGDILATSAKGIAVLGFADERTLFIFSGNTRVWFSRHGSAKLVHLTSGQMYCDVAPQKDGAQWRILTADGEAAVLGTQLTVRTDIEGTRVAVTAGRVRVTARDSRQTVETRAGYAAELTPTKATLVRLPPTEPTRVASFTVVDADTNATLPGFEQLADGAVLDLALLPTRRINIRANCEPQLVGAVRFSLEGANTHGDAVEPFGPVARPPGWNIRFPNQVELYFPYMLAGDPSIVDQPLPGHSFAWTPPVGRFTLTAVPHAEISRSGVRGTPLTVRFEVIDSSR